MQSRLLFIRYQDSFVLHSLNILILTNSWAEVVLSTADEGPLRLIQYKCLVPICVFPEMKLCSLLISNTEL
jgi:hypothetical protein